MLKKPHSNRAKSFNHPRSQDHGDAASRKGRARKRPGYYEGERSYDERGSTNADKTYLKEVIRSGLDDYYNHMTPKELEEEADRILADDDKRDKALQDLQQYEEVVYEAAETNHEQIQPLLARFVVLYKRRVELVIDRGIDTLSAKEKDELKELEETLDDLDEEITELLRSEDRRPTIGEYERKTDKEIRDKMAKAATLDYSYDEDDEVDDENFNSHIHISNRPH